MNYHKKLEIQRPSDTLLAEYEESSSICFDSSRKRMMESAHWVERRNIQYCDHPLYEEIFTTSPLEKNDVALMKHTQIDSFRYESRFDILTPKRWKNEIFKGFGFQQIQSEGQGFKVRLEKILDRTFARGISDEIYEHLAAMNKY